MWAQKTFTKYTGDLKYHTWVLCIQIWRRWLVTKIFDLNSGHEKPRLNVQMRNDNVKVLVITNKLINGHGYLQYELAYQTTIGQILCSGVW